MPRQTFSLAFLMHMTDADRLAVPPDVEATAAGRARRRRSRPTIMCIYIYIYIAHFANDSCSHNGVYAYIRQAIAKPLGARLQRSLSLPALQDNPVVNRIWFMICQAFN